MLELEGLYRHFGELQALDNLSFSAQPGRLLGFLGPNGAGKTTAMRSIFGLISLDSGRVQWRGKPVDATARSSFGYMPEQRGLYPKMKCNDQLIYFGRTHGLTKAEATLAASTWLETFGLTDRANDTLETLSHGNQQRVQLAAALVHSPDLLVLDEPFSGLDPLGVADMEEVLRTEAARGRTIIFSSHQLDLVEALCDDIVIIHRGAKALAGTLAELRATSQVRRLTARFTDPQTEWDLSFANPTKLKRRAGETTALVSSAVEVGRLLTDAQAAGEVSSFSWEPPSLAEIFVEAVNGEIDVSEVGG